MGWGFCVSRGLWCGGKNAFQQEIFVREKAGVPFPIFQRLLNQTESRSQKMKVEVLWKTVISAGIAGRCGEMTQIYERESRKGWKGDIWCIGWLWLFLFWEWGQEFHEEENRTNRSVWENQRGKCLLPKPGRSSKRITDHLVTETVPALQG